MKNILLFLENLSENNNREWFNAHKADYEAARATHIAFTDILINEIRNIDPSVPLVEPKDCVFRIFRDVRFSHNKSPYKTNFGSYISSGGKNSSKAGYYFHIEPGNIFVGGGSYMPQAEALKAIRDAICETPEEYMEIINDPHFKTTFGDIWGEEVKTYPRGYDKNMKHIDLIKKKSYVGMKQLAPELLESDRLLEEIRDAYEALYPLNRFLNDAIDR